MKRSTPTLFIFRSSDSPYSGMALHRALHGRRDIGTSTDDFGRVIHKTYEYPGIPHQDIIPGVIAVEPQHARRVVEVFKKYHVLYIRAKTKGMKSFKSMESGLRVEK